MTDKSQSKLDQLVFEFNKQFSREFLEKSPYYVYKLTTDLKIKIDDICDDKRIKSITDDQDLIKEALNKCKNVGILEGGKSAVLKLEKKKELVVTNPGSENEMEQFQDKLQDICEKLNIVNANFKFSSPNKIQISFQKDSQIIELSKELQKSGYKDTYSQEEDILFSLQNSVRQYEASKKSQQQKRQEEKQNQYDQQQQQFYNQQQYQQMCQLQMFYYQQATMFQASNENFTHVMQQKDFSDLFIRRADKDKAQQNGQKKQPRGGRKGNQITSGFDQAYQVNNMYSCLPPPFLDPMMGGMNGAPQRNNKKGNRNQRGNHHRQNNNNNRDNRSKSRKRSNDHSQSNNRNLRNRSKSTNQNSSSKQQQQNNGKRGNYQKNGKQNNSKQNNGVRNTSNSVSNNRSASKDVYVKKHNRPRLDSDNFPVLHEKNEKGEMTPVQYIQKPQKPTVKPTNTPYLENKAKISKKYTHFEIITSFERWKAEKIMNESLNQFLNDTTIPVLLNEPIGKLEIEQPHRKNSSAVTPLLTNQPTMQLRKGSAHYSSSQSPNKKQSTRKFSAQKY